MKKLFTLFATALVASSALATSEIVYSFDSKDHAGSNNAYASDCDIEIDNITWNVTGNAVNAPWRIGGKSLSKTDRQVYTKTAYPDALDKIVLSLGTCSLTSLDAVKLVYSANADFSASTEIAGTVPTAFPGTVEFAPDGGFAAKSYYKFVFTCTVEEDKNKYLQFSGVEFWGEKAVVAVEKPEFSVATGSCYDAQTVSITCATEGAEIYYTLDGTTPSASSTKYSSALTISETTTVKAIAIKGSDASEVVSKEYTIAVSYSSLADLVEKAGEPKGQKVVVTLTNEVINDIYVSSKGYRNGVYIMVGDKKIEIFCYDVPETWEVGGTISGTVKGEWKIYSGTWEVCPSSWDGITYTAAANLNSVYNTEKPNCKMMKNGKLYIISNGKTYDASGVEVK